MIVIFRHGETEYNLADKTQGWSDSPLTDKGISQVNQTALNFKGKRVDAYTRLYSSSLKRSVDSANIFQTIVPVDLYTQCDSLKERNYGEHEGLQFVPPLNEQFGQRYNPDSESLADIYERVSRFLDRERVRYDNPAYTIIFHVHFNVSRVLRGIFLQLPPAIWIDFDHRQDDYYIINGNHCQEIQC